MLTTYVGGVVAAGGIALVNSLGSLGGLISPNVWSWANASFDSKNAGLYLLACTTIIGAALTLTLRKNVSTPLAASLPTQPQGYAEKHDAH